MNLYVVSNSDPHSVIVRYNPTSTECKKPVVHDIKAPFGDVLIQDNHAKAVGEPFVGFNHCWATLNAKKKSRITVTIKGVSFTLPITKGQTAVKVRINHDESITASASNIGGYDD